MAGAINVGGPLQSKGTADLILQTASGRLLLQTPPLSSMTDITLSIPAATQNAINLYILGQDTLTFGYQAGSLFLDAGRGAGTPGNVYIGTTNAAVIHLASASAYTYLDSSIVHVLSIWLPLFTLPLMLVYSLLVIFNWAPQVGLFQLQRRPMCFLALAPMLKSF